MSLKQKSTDTRRVKKLYVIIIEAGLQANALIVTPILQRLENAF